ncbi:hypothetical protein ACQ4PT_045329 [Festuca glaucescens]
MEAEAAVLSQLQLQLLALVSDLRLTRERERAAREELHASSQDSACSLQWTLQMKDKQIAVISEKLNSHLALFNSVGKEVAAAMLKELHNMEIALGKFQDIFSSIGHEEVKSSSPVSECQDRQHYANKEQVESIPGSHCDPPNEHRLILVTDEAATATVECKSRIDTGSNQEQCPQSLKHSTLASPETVTETVEKPNCCHESKDIEMGNSSPKQQTNYVNPDLETENQS